jgi:hypothetical protein
MRPPPNPLTGRGNAFVKWWWFVENTKSFLCEIPINVYRLSVRCSPLLVRGVRGEVGMFVEDTMFFCVKY